MMIPEGNTNKLQKIYIAMTPFNLLLNEYFKKRGDNTLSEYFDNLASELINTHQLTPEDVIKQIEEKYSEYLTGLNINNVFN